MKDLLKKLRHSLFFRLLFSYLFLATVPIILIGWILIHTSQRTIERNILNRNLELAKKSAEIVESTLERARDILKLNAQNPALYRMDFIAQDIAINSVVSEFNLFQKITIIDSTGSIITSTSYALTLTPEEKLFINKRVPPQDSR